MRAIGLGARIWFFTVLGTVILLGVVALIRWGMKDLDGIGGILAILVIGLMGGLILTSPLLIPTVCLISLMTRLPFTFSTAVVWLWSMLALIIMVSSVGIVWYFDRRFPDADQELIGFIGIVLLSLLIVFRLSLSALRKFNDTVREERLQQDFMA